MRRFNRTSINRSSRAIATAAVSVLCGASIASCSGPSGAGGDSVASGASAHSPAAVHGGSGGGMGPAFDSAAPAANTVASQALTLQEKFASAARPRAEAPTADASTADASMSEARPAPPPAAPAPNAAPATTATQSAPASSSMVIRSGTASVQVDSLEIAIGALRARSAAFGGFVGNTSIALGEDQVRRATLEIKVPAAQYDAAIAGLTPLGKVESVNSTAEDVGEEFVDLTARVANARRLEARLITLLDTRAGKLQDALAVERELSRVREEIERIEGRARYLSSRAAMSTLTVYLHEPFPIVSANPGQNILVEAFRDAWRTFVRVIAALIASLGVLIPVGVIAATGALAWRRRPRTPAAVSPLNSASK